MICERQVNLAARNAGGIEGKKKGQATLLGGELGKEYVSVVFPFTDKRWWHLTDVQFSTVANINDAANLIEERIMYDAYGNALQRPYKDVDGDRDYDVNDYNTIQTLAAGGGTPISSGSYDPDADLDRSGTIDSTDVTLATTTYITANPVLFQLPAEY